jgi:putative flippase GtrA
LRRYIAAYAIGYIINYLALWSLVDIGGFPHQYVQGVMIFLLAGMLFIMQKYWVFALKPFKTNLKESA